jgi:hypothetical protein
VRLKWYPVQSGDVLLLGDGRHEVEVYSTNITVISTNLRLGRIAFNYE